MALALYRTWLCPLCGGPIEVCTSNEETGPQFEVRRVRCRITDARIAASEDAKNTDRPGAVLSRVIQKE